MIINTPIYRINVTAERNGVIETFTAFHFRGNPEHGIARARKEAPEFGWNIHSIRAIPTDGMGLA